LVFVRTGIGHVRRRDGVQGTRRGFTLIELLVVISIIGVLIGILVPTLGSARETSRRLKCLVNLRSIGQGLQLYTQTESKGILPFVRSLHDPNAPKNDPSLLDILAVYIDSPTPTRDSPDGPFKVTDPYQCPSDRELDSSGMTTAQSSGSSYEYGAGGAMIITELRLCRNPALGVTRAYESGRDWPVVYDARPWHKLRSSGPQSNAVFFNDFRSDWAIDIPQKEMEAFLADAIKYGSPPGGGGFP
jgi:prepilin-type N-terminal cleavage/methylation domain-containing protein